MCLVRVVSFFSRNRKSQEAKPVQPRGFRANVSRERHFLLLTSGHWLLAGGFGSLCAFCFLPLYIDVSLWVGLALFISGVIVVHLRYASNHIVPFPHIALLVIAAQLVFAAWASYRFPSGDPLIDIGPRLPEYLEFSTLAFLACTIGWSLCLARLRVAAAPRLHPSSELRQCLDLLIVCGVVAGFAWRYLRDTNLNFVIVLLINLRYLGLFGWMICRQSGWGWRFAAVFGLELFFSSDRGSFGNFIMLGLWVFAFWVFLFKTSWLKLVLIFVVALLLLPTMHQSKWELRKRYWGEGAVHDSPFEKFGLWLYSFGDSMEQTMTLNLDRDQIGDTITRYNQGWIINRVMEHVPGSEPFAGGETLREAVIATLLPRFLLPGKVVAGGRANMERFTGIDLGETASMNLGFAGEMYANFGFWGGVIGSGIYSLLFALVFRWIFMRASTSPLWWAVMPYIGFLAFKAEDGIAEVVNWTFKASIMMVAICWAFPAFRRELFPAGASIRSKKSRRGDSAGMRGGPARAKNRPDYESGLPTPESSTPPTTGT